MTKASDNLGIIGVAVVIAILIFASQFPAASAKSYSYTTDPVPGGMCRCISCNCLMEAIDEQVEEELQEDLSTLESVLTSKQLAAVGALIARTDENEPAPRPTTNPTGSAPRPTSNPGSNPQPTNPNSTPRPAPNPGSNPQSLTPTNTSGNTPRPAPNPGSNPQPTTNPAVRDNNRPGTPSSLSPSNPGQGQNTRPPAGSQSSGSTNPGQGQNTRPPAGPQSASNPGASTPRPAGNPGAATGRSSGSYPYISDKPENTPDSVRNQFLGSDTLEALERRGSRERIRTADASGFVAPTLDSSVLDPRFFGPVQELRLIPGVNDGTANPPGPVNMTPDEIRARGLQPYRATDGRIYYGTPEDIRRVGGRAI